MLLEERLVTAAQLEEALEAQVVHGGKLGTNLCELGFLQEKDLARLLGKLHNCPYASGEMQPDPAAMALADEQFLDDNDCLPMRADATRLTVAVSDPTKFEALDQLGFKAGKRIVKVVIPEFRMNQLLRRYCKAYRNLRPIDMNTLRPSKQAEANERKIAVTSELINEDDFQKLYAQALVGGEAAPAAAEDAPIMGEAIEDSHPSGPRPRRSAPGVDKPEPPLEPMSFPEAQKTLSKSNDREDIGRTVLRFALSKWKRALILSVQGDLVTGWKGGGENVTPGNVRRIGVSLKEKNTFRLVRDTRSHYVGPMARDPSTAVFYKLLGGGFPGTAVMMPLLVRAKPVHFVYVDNGPKQITTPDIGELLILAQAVSRSYEQLIQRRKAKHG
jgi:hypothetical protein